MGKRLKSTVVTARWLAKCDKHHKKGITAQGRACLWAAASALSKSVASLWLKHSDHVCLKTGLMSSNKSKATSAVL